MTLAIDRFATRCRASPRAAAERGRIERVVRTDFVEHCGRELATAFRGHEGVIRIRRLALKLALPRAGLGDVALARNWAASFAVSLRRALASPEGGAIEIRRYASRADWLAAAIAAALAGELSGRWEFAELRWIGALPLGDALRRILDLDGSLAGDVLIRLRQRGHLEALLLNLDEVALEQLQRRLDDGARGADPVDVDALIECAELVLREPWRSERLVSRRRAIALWASLVERPGRRQTLRRVSDALVALDLLNRAFAAARRDDLASRLRGHLHDEAR
ncbi:MAG TPA: hypothetical protein VKB52_05385, partial [Rhodanobacteraceae bacterium]|nr:hypothetical protein [Rhodanobacteraceae bacterium]